MSFIILSRAVSVLCPGLQADWEVGKRLLALRYAESCDVCGFFLCFFFPVTFEKEKKKDCRWAGSFSNCSGQDMAFSEVVLQGPL